jgi:hypothetical protein
MASSSSDRPTTPRLHPLTASTPELAEILAGGIKNGGGQPLNIFGTMAHHPKLLKRFMTYGGYFLNKGLVPAREREVVILRVGWRTGSVYEFGQHTLIGRQCGLTDDEIAALAQESATTWSSKDSALIAMVDDLCADNCVSEGTWNALKSNWSDAQLVELVLLAGSYRMVAGFLNTMGVQLDTDTPGWPN